MSSPADGPPPQPRLHCLGGGEPPPSLSGDLRALSQLSPIARARLWDALGPSLAEPVPSAVEALLDEFCHKYDVPGELLARVLKACRFLLREASRLDLPRAAFAEDLSAIAGDSKDVSAFLLSGYEKAKAFVRREIVHSALVEHGKLLVGIDWRLDTINASARGSKLQIPTVLLTLRYREGSREERLTLHATLDVIKGLKQLWSEIIR
jgi:hypothetical protein